jgi:hypothetical protein
MSVRRRKLDKLIRLPGARFTKNGEFVNPEEPYRDWKWEGIQLTESEGHKKSRDGHYYEGGPFFTFRIEVDIPSIHVDLRPPGSSIFYNGPVCMPLVPNTLKQLGFSEPSSDSSFLDPYGAIAVAQCAPTNPNAQLGVALGEIIKDRYLPIPVIQAWKRRTKVAKAAGSEYLNAVFGWMPLTRDMKNTAQSVLDGNEILKNHHSLSGTNVHREFNFPDVLDTDTDFVGNTTPKMGVSSPEFSYAGVEEVSRTRIHRRRRWFSGAFTYSANKGSSSATTALGYGSDAEKLFGITLTPDVVWELTPWSWAIDWFSNTGDVIHNASALALAGLVMRYGYIMEEDSIVDTYSMPPYQFYQGKTVPIPAATVTYSVKRRREANPFGFGLQWEGLSPT